MRRCPTPPIGDAQRVLVRASRNQGQAGEPAKSWARQQIDSQDNGLASPIADAIQPGVRCPGPLRFAACVNRWALLPWSSLGLMSSRPLSWVLFDLNGTLLDPSGIAGPLGGDDQSRRLVGEAFHEALLLTMADTLSGGVYRPLPEYLRSALERGLRAEGASTEALDEAMERAAAMDPFPDAEAAMSLLAAEGLRLGVLTNSTTAAAEQALEIAGLVDRLAVVIGSDQAQTFKPHPRAYEHGVERVKAEPEEIILVAAHGWDVMGAMRAGLRGAWVAHSEHWLVPVVPEPDVRGENLEDVAAKIIALRT